MSRPSQKELESLGNLGDFLEQPNLVTDVFKNRRGRWTQVRIWSKNDLGCCRRQDLFITNIKLEPIQGFKIVNIFEKDSSYEIVDFSQDDTPAEQDLEIFNKPEEAEQAFGTNLKKRWEGVDMSELL
jgi:hypothetical protein